MTGETLPAELYTEFLLQLVHHLLPLLSLCRTYRASTHLFIEPS